MNRKKLEAVYVSLAGRLVERAREDINTFVEFVMRDEAGQPFVQDEAHAVIQNFITACWNHGRWPVILAHWGMGKTSQMIARILWEIGRDRNLRVKIVCNSDGNAVARVKLIGQYITESPEYRMVFPDVVPDREGSWSGHQLFIQREGKSADPTVEAKSVLATAVGARSDLLVFDDVVDYRNAVVQPALRETVIETYRNVWLSRMEPWGRLVYIATAWTQNDLTSWLQTSCKEDSRYAFLIQRIASDFGGIDCEIWW